MDILVRKSKKNYHKIVAAFLEFGMPTFDLTEANFLENEKVVIKLKTLGASFGGF